jgi:hypothetical protein
MGSVRAGAAGTPFQGESSTDAMKNVAEMKQAQPKTNSRPGRLRYRNIRLRIFFSVDT